jgi:hypothetical protein
MAATVRRPVVATLAFQRRTDASDRHTLRTLRVGSGFQCHLSGTVREMEWTALAFVVTTLSFVAVAPASAATGCGTERRLSDGRVFRVKAHHANCRTAKDVAGGWFHVQSTGGSGRKVYDRQARLWRCRIVRKATGTDPGYNPYTVVRCTRGSKIVSFKLRS